MCGICGFLSTDDAKPPSRSVLEQMVHSLRHRGPDEQSVHIDGPLGLGHARLSIIDLDGGRQPLFNEDRSVVVICNGEIYNYRQLRSELIEKGHQFSTGSDTEVIVHLWEEEGPELLDRLRGMFSFVLYDSDHRLLFGARDRFGQKPFYYHHNSKRFSFSSEIKGLLPLPDLNRRLDTVALDQFLFYQFVPQPRTMFEDVRQLPPAHFFLLKDNRLVVSPYWEPQFNPQDDVCDNFHLDCLEDALLDAVSSHMVSDVPVGVFLSGGIDSSLMVAAASRVSSKPLRTFSIGFPGSSSDESKYARLAARHFGTEHQEFAFQPEKVEESLTKIAEIFDQPLADSAAMPLLHLSQQASKELKVVLTGDGGDELFGGYRKYRRAATRLGNSRLMFHLAHNLFQTSRLATCAPDRLRLRKIRSRVGMLLVPTQRSSYHRRYWEGWDRHSLYQPDFAANLTGDFRAVDDGNSGGVRTLESVNVMLKMDQESYLPDDLLLKTDHTTMAHGLEARAPLLDHRLAEVAGRLPMHLKVTPRETKAALRRIAERWLPEELSSRPKKGFSFPLKQWFRHELRDWVHNNLIENATTVPQYFRPEHIEQVLAEHTAGKRDHSGRIYSLLAFELWHRNYMA